MDVGFDDLLSGNNVKPSTKFKNFKPKGPTKPRPKPITQPEPISTPTPPPTQSVVTVDNEIIPTTEEEHVNQVSININDDQHKPHEENDAEPFLTMESLDDILPQSTTVTVTVDSPTINVSMDENVDKGKGPTEIDLESFSQIDPLTGDEACIFNNNEDFHIENLSKDAESSLMWESSDILSESRTCAGQKVEKCKPKAPTRIVENSNPSEIDYMDNETGPMFTPDELFGSSPNGITDSIPVPDYHVNGEPQTFTEMLHSDHLDAIPETPLVGYESVKKGKRQSSEPSPGRSSERLRRQSKKSLSLVDEPDDDEVVDDIIHANEDNNNYDNNDIDEYVPENESVNERKGRKSKKPVNDKEKEKPVRKRKRANEESTKVKKKFPHSTRRRNKRQVDPELLKISEDQLELHMHTIPMKELIRLAEHKERLAKKEASTSGTPALNQDDGSLANDYDQEEGTEAGYEHENVVEAQNATYYNYGTHMKITPRTRWTKQDTELFYEAIQQFGTDLSMIKECFPGRTREQIKSKYKKEEKQHPLRLNDALTTRFKGNSHFEVVIQRLKEAQGEDSENEDLTNLTGEDDVAPDDINLQEGGETRESVETEKKDEEEEEEMEVKGDVGSPTKSNDSEDDILWSQYKSDL